MLLCNRLWHTKLNVVKLNLETHSIHLNCFNAQGVYLWVLHLLLLSVVSSIMPESFPLDELWELRVDWRPRDPFPLSIPPSLSLSPESFPLESPSISSELCPLRLPDEPPDPEPPLGEDEPSPDPLPCPWDATLALVWQFLGESSFSESAPRSLFLSSALATRPRVLPPDIDLELS